VVNVAIDGVVQEAQADELLIDLINRTDGSVPHVCYHPQLGLFRPVTRAWLKRTAVWSGPARPESPMG